MAQPTVGRKIFTWVLISFFNLYCRPVSWLEAAEEPDESGADEKRLTLEGIFQSDDFDGGGFSGEWLEDSSGYTTFESSDAPGGGRDLVRHDPATGEKEVLVPASDFAPPDGSPLRVSHHEWSRDGSKLLLFTNTKRVWRAATRGDYWVLDRTSHELWKLGGDAPASSLMFAKFSPEADRVAFVRERNLYVQDLRSRLVRALTSDGGPGAINGTFDWVYEEELFLRDGFRWSPEGRHLAYWRFDTSGVREYPMVNFTDSLYPDVTWLQYPKAGERNASGRVGVLSLETGSTRWMKVPGDERNHYIHYMEWPEGSEALVLQQFNRLQNTNRVMLADPMTGEVEVLLTERDDAWVEQQQDLHWRASDRRFFWLSERDGWRHVYGVTRDGERVRLKTAGDYDVIELLHVDQEEGDVYFTASPENATQAYLYRTRAGRGSAERITPADRPGTHRYEISPDGRWAVHSWSRMGEPGRTELISLPDHGTVRELEDPEELRKNYEALDRGTVEFMRVDLGDGVELDGWMIAPPEYDASRVYPLLVHVYGEPAGQTVLDRWGGKGFLWHLMLAQEGYFVASFDNRGTPAPRGRDWRKHVYRQVGILAPQDQAAAVRALLKDRPYLDPDRVGVWGWSGGGSMTLNAMFKFPELYAAGIAVASVPNQRYYDTIYQERYMGLPGDNVEGYREGSAIHFADRLQGRLLIVHGTGDDNVHYQGVEALINELVRHQKQFELMVYPNRSHSISERTGTTLHLRRLMTEFLREALPAGARDRKAESEDGEEEREEREEAALESK